MKVPEHFRLRAGPMGSDANNGNNGAFIVRLANGTRLEVIASDEGGWEHVSVSRRDRCPLWDEMCAVKALFWEPDECVVQFHPPEVDYISQHPYCLHMWRCTDGRAFPMPPSVMVGCK